MRNHVYGAARQAATASTTGSAARFASLVCLLGIFAATPASAAIITYQLAGSYTGPTPALSGTVNATINLDPTASPIYFGASDPSYVFNTTLTSLSITGSPAGVASLQSPTAYFIQWANRLTAVGGPGFEFLLTTNKANISFCFPYGLSTGMIGTVQPVPALSGTLFVYDTVSNQFGYGTATVAVAPEPTTLLLVAATPLVSLRRRRVS